MLPVLREFMHRKLEMHFEIDVGMKTATPGDAASCFINLHLIEPSAAEIWDFKLPRDF